MNPMELAFLIQLVQEDKILNKQLNLICSSLYNVDKQKEEENPNDCKDQQTNNNLRRNSMECQSQALRSASSAYQELLDWASHQNCTSIHTEHLPVGRQLHDTCRSLGYLPVPAIEHLVPKKPVRILCNGVFDLVHAGHFNALRQAAQLGDELYVGICSDETMVKAKGAYPVQSIEERAEIIGACKWVAGVLLNTPYDIDVEFFATSGCDFVAHGDDIALNSKGVDCYEEFRKIGLLKLFKRTEGISTTTIISRLLAVDDDGSVSTSSTTCDSSLSSDGSTDSPPLMNQAIVSSRRLLQFMGMTKPPRPNDKVVYIDGSFDFFHNGHLRLFQKAKALGDFLMVGVYNDETVRNLKGPGFPIQQMLHRVLSVMAIRHVDEVLMGAPNVIDENFIKSYRISTYLRGCCTDTSDSPPFSELEKLKDLCEVVVISSESSLTTKSLVNRIRASKMKLSGSVARRRVKELFLYNDVERLRCQEL